MDHPPPVLPSCRWILPTHHPRRSFSHPSADIVRDFQSESLQEEWNKFGAKVMDRRAQRENALHRAREASEHKIRAVHDNARQLTTTMAQQQTDQLEAQFRREYQSSDQKATELLGRYGMWTNRSQSDKDVDDPSKVSKPLPCLGPRAHWIECQQKYHPDSRPCVIYVEALEECVRQTLAASQYNKTKM
jgi:glycerol-3-phosphate dehydrogenase